MHFIQVLFICFIIFNILTPNLSPLPMSDPYLSPLTPISGHWPVPFALVGPFTCISLTFHLYPWQWPTTLNFDLHPWNLIYTPVLWPTCIFLPFSLYPCLLTVSLTFDLYLWHLTSTSVLHLCPCPFHCIPNLLLYLGLLTCHPYWTSDLWSTCMTFVQYPWPCLPISLTFDLYHCSLTCISSLWTLSLSIGLYLGLWTILLSTFDLWSIAFDLYPRSLTYMYILTIALNLFLPLLYIPDLWPVYQICSLIPGLYPDLYPVSMTFDI